MKNIEQMDPSAIYTSSIHYIFFQLCPALINMSTAPSVFPSRDSLSRAVLRFQAQITVLANVNSVPGTAWYCAPSWPGQGSPGE